MPKYEIYALITGSKYLGEFEAANRKEAEALAWDSENCDVGFCHQCADECDEPQINELDVNLVIEEEKEDG